MGWSHWVKPEGFLERQVRGWFERWNRAKTEEIPLMERLIGWLTERMPASPAQRWCTTISSWTM